MMSEVSYSFLGLSSDIGVSFSNKLSNPQGQHFGV